MRSFEQYDETCKYFAEGKQRDNNANEIQKHLQLYDLSLGEYLVHKYALWLDFIMTDENELHGTGRRIENASEGITLQIEKIHRTGGRIENASEGITLQIEKKAESAGAKCLHLSDHGCCSVKHPKWCIHFCYVLE